MKIGKATEVRSAICTSNAQAIVVRGGKGDKDRVVMLPRTLVPRLQEQLMQ